MSDNVHETGWSVRPLKWGCARENELSRSIYDVLLRWIPFANQQYQDWDGRRGCGHFFGGNFWYSADSAHTAVVFAVVAKLGEYDEQITGIPRDIIKSRAIRAIRYMGFTHDTGPADCLRVDGPNKYTSRKKWGGAGDNFFMASQNGRPIACMAQAAWLLWEDLEDETKGLVQNVVGSYADRWSHEEPRTGAYFDTQCEENAWTSAGIGAAVAMFPEHPHHAEWQQALDRWSVNAVTTSRDRLLEPSDLLEMKGPSRLKTVTFHPDFTAENHAFVHPSYMCAGTNLRALHVVLSLMGGTAPAATALYNNVEVYEHTIKRWMQFDGLAVPVQGQDWWYNRQHERQLTHAVLNVCHQNSDAACFERYALTSIKHIQQSNENGCLLEERGDECVINRDHAQFAKDLEHGSANDLVTSYLLHVFGGPGVEASNQDEMMERLSGVYEYPHGGVIVHRTKSTFTSFSWRNHVMALSLPSHGMWTVTPLMQSFIGVIRVAENAQTKKFANEELVRDVVSRRISHMDEGFGAVVRISRGEGKVMQDVAFISLPTGDSVYMERFCICEPHSTVTMQTGMMGIRNENYRAMPSIAKGYRKIYLRDGSHTFDGFYGRELNSVRHFGVTDFVNIDDEMGYVLYGSQGTTYVNQHEYPKWKGVEDVLILNDRQPHLFTEKTMLDPFVVVAMPNRTADETRNAASTVAKLESNSAGAILMVSGTKLIYANFDSTTAVVSGEKCIDSSNSSSIGLFPGTNRLHSGHYIWTGELGPQTSGYLSERYDITLDGIEGVSLAANVLADRVVFSNHSAFPIRFMLTTPDGMVHQHMSLDAGGYSTVAESGKYVL